MLEATLSLSSGRCISRESLHTLGYMVITLSSCSDNSNSDLLLTASEILTTFVDIQGSSKNPATPESRLKHILLNALGSSHAVQDSAGWAVSLLAVIICLCDTAIFSHARSLKLCVEALKVMHNQHTGRTWRILRISIWKCFMRSYGRSNVSNAKQDIYLSPSEDKQFMFVKQDVSREPHLGVILVVVLLYTSGDNCPYRVDKILLILQSMLKHPVTAGVGCELMMRLLHGGPLPIKSWDQNALLDRFLFDGTLSQVNYDQLSTWQSENNLGIDHLRAFTESEMNDHWDDLVSTWLRTVDICLRTVPQNDAFMV